MQRADKTEKTKDPGKIFQIITLFSVHTVFRIGCAKF